MKAKERSHEKESHAAPFSFPCGDFQKMAEMMKAFCASEGDAMECCSFMRKMMGQDKEAEGKDTKETQK